MNNEKLQSALDEQANNITPADEKKIKLKFPEKHRKLSDSHPFIRKMLHKLKVFYRMVFDRSYHFSQKNRYIVLGALLYFIIPFDLLSDFIPVFGYIDDAMIVKLAWKSVQEEVDKYNDYLSSLTM